jgi:hypothetical protein
VRELLVRAREDDLSDQETEVVARHLQDCHSCARYDLDLRHTEQVLRRPAAGPLPPFRPLARTTSFQGSRFLRLAGAAIVVAGIALAMGLGLQRVREVIALPSASPATAVLSTGRPTAGSVLAFLDHQTSTLILVDQSGSEVGRSKLGEGVITLPSIHAQSGRIALWRVPGRERQSPAEIVVWDGTATKVIATVTDLVPWSAPMWSSDGATVAFTVASAPSEGGPNTPPRHGRLIVLELASGAQRVLRSFEREWPIIPLGARADLIAGIELPFDGNGRYVTIDARTGSTISVARREEPYSVTSFAAESSGRVIAGRSQRPGSSGPAALMIWPAEEYERRVKVLETAIMGQPTFWPGRSDVLVTGTRTFGGTYELFVIGQNGSVRSLLRSERPLDVAAVSPDGSAILLDEGIAHELVVYSLSDSGLGAPGRSIARPSSGPGTPGPELLGWLRR